ncbi:DUF4846 domain-containing protein [Chitinophaga sp. SYP-B3965]|uniref:DUF4846 domain-containing protein n=1 Tax=Chitinophaga sp. SYP-B3965 TaxID=2663120 RepID=UPI001C12A6D2|nr:DUF4846 domain-containing protein [Chitinophaga sp. SYP-B3965]
MKYILIASLFFTHSLPAQTVQDLPLPSGYSRLPQTAGTFGAWLRKVTLKKDNTVYLYNGDKKTNQSAQFAVLDISVGKKDLQQCADAVMRLYAEYRYANRELNHITFKATDGSVMDYAGWAKGDRFALRNGRLKRSRTATPAENRAVFTQYLEFVFSYAGTLSLSRELQPVTDIQPGDVYIQGGSPGHAVIVMDVAVNKAGKKIFLLAQSYMPAQDIHILRNPVSGSSPWYEAAGSGDLLTPEWTFSRGDLKRFK